MSERRKPTRGLGVPKDLGYGPSNIEMNELFANIGRAKESVAQSITEQQKKEDERKRSVLNKLFAKKDDAMPGVADTAVDDELAEIERKLALVRAGELHEYDQASNDSDAPDVIDERTEPAADESAVTNEPDILMDDADMESTDVAMESGPVPEDVPAAAEERTEEHRRKKPNAILRGTKSFLPRMIFPQSRRLSWKRSFRIRTMWTSRSLLKWQESPLRLCRNPGPRMSWSCKSNRT